MRSCVFSDHGMVLLTSLLLILMMKIVWTIFPTSMKYVHTQWYACTHKQHNVTSWFQCIIFTLQTSGGWSVEDMLNTNKNMVWLVWLINYHNQSCFFTQFNVKSTYTDDLQGYTYVKLHALLKWQSAFCVCVKIKTIGNNEKEVSFQYLLNCTIQDWVVYKPVFVLLVLCIGLSWSHQTHQNICQGREELRDWHKRLRIEIDITRKGKTVTSLKKISIALLLDLTSSNCKCIWLYH